MKLAASDILDAGILIVDDQESNVRLLEQLLGEAGYTRVSSTMNPQEVCALHRRNAYDLILLDLQMPGIDGFQVMEGLKTNETDGYLPVIVLTAQPGHKLRALQAGAKDFISKPFDLVEVRTRIRNMLEVRLLYKMLESYSKELEKTVQERTAELRESEARFRSLTELASDWYWEQDDAGNFTRVSGPVLEMLGIRVDSLAGARTDAGMPVWNESEREVLQTMIAARQPFLDFAFSRVNADGSRQVFQVSGEPMFDQSCRFIGYRGIGIELPARDIGRGRCPESPCHCRTVPRRTTCSPPCPTRSSRAWPAPGAGPDAAGRNAPRAGLHAAARLLPDHRHRVAPARPVVGGVGRGRGRGQRGRPRHRALHGRRHHAHLGRRADRGLRLPARGPGPEGGIRSRRAGAAAPAALHAGAGHADLPVRRPATATTRSSSSCAGGCC